jgi:hypothetical protein
LIAGRITDPLMRKAFDYWSSNSSIDKWVALPPAPPAAMLDAYRDTYTRMIADADFVERGRKMSDDFEPWPHGEVESLIGVLGTIPPEAIERLGAMLRKQGLYGQ